MPDEFVPRCACGRAIGWTRLIRGMTCDVCRLISKPRWGKLEKGKLSIGVGHHSMRKSVCVMVQRGSVLYTVAYCRNEEEADRLWHALLELTGNT
jgi:hypothetical protein